MSLHKTNSVGVNDTRIDRMGVPIIKIPRSEMESPSKKSKKDKEEKKK